MSLCVARRAQARACLSTRTPCDRYFSDLGRACARGRGVTLAGVGPSPAAHNHTPVRMFADAAPDPRFPGKVLVGLWSHGSFRMRHAPACVTTPKKKQSAELYSALVSVDEITHAMGKHIQLVMDNMGAIAQLNRAKAHLVEYHRSIRRLAHQLRWTGALIHLY